MNKLCFYLNSALECRQKGKVHVKQIKLQAKYIEAAVNDERNESSLNKIEKGDYNDLPFHLLEAILMPPRCHQLLYYRNKHHLEEGNHNGKHKKHDKVYRVILCESFAFRGGFEVSKAQLHAIRLQSLVRVGHQDLLKSQIIILIDI